MEFNSWKYLAFDKTEFKCNYLDDCTFTLKIGGNVVAQTKIAHEYGKFLVPQFFLNAFDFPVAEYHLIRLEIEQYEETQVLEQQQLYFHKGHHSTKRNTTRDILVEYYDKSFEKQQNRNVLRFFGGLSGLMYIPNLTNEILLSDYLKLLNNVKYRPRFEKLNFIRGNDIKFQLSEKIDTGTLIVTGGMKIGGKVTIGNNTYCDNGITFINCNEIKTKRD